MISSLSCLFWTSFSDMGIWIFRPPWASNMGAAVPVKLGSWAVWVCWPSPWVRCHTTQLSSRWVAVCSSLKAANSRILPPALICAPLRYSKRVPSSRVSPFERLLMNCADKEAGTAAIWLKLYLLLLVPVLIPRNFFLVWLFCWMVWVSFVAYRLILPLAPSVMLPVVFSSAP